MEEEAHHLKSMFVLVCSLLWQIGRGCTCRMWMLLCKCRATVDETAAFLGRLFSFFVKDLIPDRSFFFFLGKSDHFFCGSIVYVKCKGGYLVGVSFVRNFRGVPTYYEERKFISRWQEIWVSARDGGVLGVEHSRGILIRITGVNGFRKFEVEYFREGGREFALFRYLMFTGDGNGSMSTYWRRLPAPIRKFEFSPEPRDLPGPRPSSQRNINCFLFMIFLPSPPRGGGNATRPTSSPGLDEDVAVSSLPWGCFLAGKSWHFPSTTCRMLEYRLPFFRALRLRPLSSRARVSVSTFE